MKEEAFQPLLVCHASTATLSIKLTTSNFVLAQLLPGRTGFLLPYHFVRFRAPLTKGTRSAKNDGAHGRYPQFRGTNVCWLSVTPSGDGGFPLLISSNSSRGWVTQGDISSATTRRIRSSFCYNAKNSTRVIFL